MTITKRTVIVLTRFCPICESTTTDRLQRKFVDFTAPNVRETAGGFGATMERICRPCVVARKNQ